MKIKNYLNKEKKIFNQYNKLLKYNKFIELISIDLSRDNNIILNDIHISNDNSIEYNPEILFSIRRSIEYIYNKNKLNINSIDELNKYIEIIPKINNNSISDNNTTIVNYNTLYSFSNNNIIENKNVNNNNDIIRNEDINIVIKDNKYNSTMVQNNLNSENNKNNIKIYQSVNLDELMKRIKIKKNFNCCDYQEDDIKCKYLSLKLLNKFISNKKEGLKYLIFKKIKALFYINNKNKIQNQINIIINEKEE